MKKYTNHIAEQKKHILKNSLVLFCRQGLNVSMSTIAKECHMTRTTLYKYFPDSDSIMWTIIESFYNDLGKLLYAQAPKNALDRYKIFFDSITSLYEKDPSLFYFLNLFFPEYQKESSKIQKEKYKKYFAYGSFGTKDTVNYLEDNFYDGSIRKDLQAHLTAVAAAYTACFTLMNIPMIDTELTIKYGIPPICFAKAAFSIFLEGMQPISNHKKDS